MQYLEPSQVPAHLKGGYTGRKFKVQVCETMTIPADAGVWGGGSRETYHVMRLATGESAAAVNHNAAPWSGRSDRTVDLKDGFVVVEHSIFCGKDMGLTFYVHPDNAAKLLPAPTAEVSANAYQVLNIICGIKSGYREDEYRREGLTREQVETAKSELRNAGLIDVRGAATVAGRNARKR